MTAKSTVLGRNLLFGQDNHDDVPFVLPLVPPQQRSDDVKLKEEESHSQESEDAKPVPDNLFATALFPKPWEVKQDEPEKPPEPETLGVKLSSDDDKPVTKEDFDKMTYSEMLKFSETNPDLYAEFMKN